MQDTVGAPVRGYDDYDPWGYILAGRSLASSILPTTTRNKFTEKEWDDEFGLNWNYFGARSYDAQIGRWPVRDPLDEYSSPYIYVGNNPIRFTDLFGLSSTDTTRGRKENPYPGPEINVRARPGRLFGLGLMGVGMLAAPIGDVTGVSDLGKAVYGVTFDPYTGQGRGLTGLERALSAAVTAVVIIPTIKLPIGFAKGTAKFALVENRLQHAARHLIDKGVLPNWNNQTKQKFIELATFILENPTQAYEKVITGGTHVKVFVAEVEGKLIEIWISKGGQVPAGEIVTSIVR